VAKSSNDFQSEKANALASTRVNRMSQQQSLFNDHLELYDSLTVPKSVL